ncbi:hypothetical protein BV898_10830 [Hypsibius exemplaris]|uniref:Uncharacterized protein n=1 Tax=Hypsibius exemplaris TaxID=2072580 RepID=A0A1W0WIC4_HYPEX|nr:hypothetical protein BV898_10830 [Hypsibius exemplaris]
MQNRNRRLLNRNRTADREQSETAPYRNAANCAAVRYGLRGENPAPKSRSTFKLVFCRRLHLDNGHCVGSTQPVTVPSTYSLQYREFDDEEDPLLYSSQANNTDSRSTFMGGKATDWDFHSRFPGPGYRIPLSRCWERSISAKLHHDDNVSWNLWKE